MPEGALDNVGFLIAAVVITVVGLVGYAGMLRNRIASSRARRRELTQGGNRS